MLINTKRFCLLNVGKRQQISSQLLGNDVAVAEVAFFMDIKTPKLIVEKCCHFSCKGELNCKPRPENLIVL